MCYKKHMLCYITHDMLYNKTHDMLCYNTWYVCYITHDVYVI